MLVLISLFPFVYGIMLDEVRPLEDNKPIIVIAMYVGGIIFINLIAAVLYLTINMGSEELTMIRVNSISNLLYYGSLAVVFIIVFRTVWKQAVSHALKQKSAMIGYVLSGIIVMLLGMFALGFLYQIIGIEESPENQALLEAQLNGPLFDKVSLAVFAVLFAPVVEEFVFRYGVIELFRRIQNIPIVIPLLLSSLLFGLMHVIGDQPIQLVYYAVLGLILGGLYIKSKNIIVPTIVHLVFNLFVTITMFMQL
jgi:membrane protease YdiL (CAAX protease family)